MYIDIHMYTNWPFAAKNNKHTPFIRLSSAQKKRVFSTKDPTSTFRVPVTLWCSRLRSGLRGGGRRLPIVPPLPPSDTSTDRKKKKLRAQSHTTLSAFQNKIQEGELTLSGSDHEHGSAAPCCLASEHPPQCHTPHKIPTRLDS